MRRHPIRWLVVLALVCSPASVFAEPRAMVDDFKGPGARQVRAAVVRVLEAHDVELLPPKKVKKAARSTGAALDTESGRVRMGKKLRIAAFIQGRTRPARRKLQLTVTVYGGRDGMVATEWKTEGAKPAAVIAEIQNKLWGAIASALDDAPAVEPKRAEPKRAEPVVDDLLAEEETAPTPKPAPSRAQPQRQPVRRAPPEREVVAARQEEDDEEPEAPSNREAFALEKQTDQGEPDSVRPSPFDISVGALVGTRSFSYNDSLPGLRVYSLGLSPSLALHAHWYPAAHVSGGALAHLGLDVRADLLVGVSSKDTSGQRFPTNSHGFGVGLRGRIPLDSVELGLVGGFSQRAFSVSSSNRMDPGIPDVVYNALRFGLEVRYQFIQSLAIQLCGAYLMGLSLGEIADKAWFPHASGNGIDAELGVQLNMSRLFAIELALGMQRYFMSLDPEPADPGVLKSRVAGGALDKYFSSRLGIVVRP